MCIWGNRHLKKAPENAAMIYTRTKACGCVETVDEMATTTHKCAWHDTPGMTRAQVKVLAMKLYMDIMESWPGGTPSEDERRTIWKLIANSVAKELLSKKEAK